MGALDVCPFVPVSGVTVAECVFLAKEFGRRLALDLGVPVYLYGDAAEKGDYRKTMPQIRAGEYEGLKKKLQQSEWQPDFGDTEFVSSWGATVTGVRKFLIAYNINMIATKEQAHRIALNLRSQGRSENNPGRLRNCQAIGWYLEEKNLAQISVNLTDFDVTPIHVAYEEARKDAAEMQLPVTGSEIVGLVPLRSLILAADYYIEKEGLFVIEEEHKVQLAINRLGLSQLSPFTPNDRIIEYCLTEGGGALRGVGELGRGSVASLIKGVAARTAAPGGGSVAAAVAGLGSALGAMVGQLTYGKRQWDKHDAVMRQCIPPLHNTALAMIPAIDADTQAFSHFMDARRLPSATPSQQDHKTVTLAAAAKGTVESPLSIMRGIEGSWAALTQVAQVGNINCKSDVQVGGRCLETGSWGAYYNVLINLDNIGDLQQREAYKKEAEILLASAQRNLKEVLNIADKRTV